MDIIRISLHDQALLHATFQTYAAADACGRVLPATWQWPEFLAHLTHPDPGAPIEYFAGLVDGEVVTMAIAQAPVKDNTHALWGEVYTPPQHRRRGYGRAMATQQKDYARVLGRRVHIAEAVTPLDGSASAGALFAEALGYQLDLEDVRRVLTLPVGAALLDELASKAAPHHGDYWLTSFTLVPDELIRPYASIQGRFATLVPQGELGVWEAEVVDEARVRSQEAQLEASGRTRYTTVARYGNQIAGYTELVHSTADGNVYQWATMVEPGHRGHRLGLALKVANQRWLQSEQPNARAVLTWNAGVNDHMIAINDRLGFNPDERLREYAIRL